MQSELFVVEIVIEKRLDMHIFFAKNPNVKIRPNNNQRLFVTRFEERAEYPQEGYDNPYLEHRNKSL